MSYYVKCENLKTDEIIIKEVVHSRRKARLIVDALRQVDSDIRHRYFITSKYFPIEMKG